MAILKKRVHIVPVAFEFDRAVLPVTDIGADKVYLLTGAQEGEGPKSSLMGARVHKALKDKVKEIEIVNYGFYDYDAIFKELVKIARKEKGSEVLINLSSGGRIVSIAGILAASMYAWTPYYAKPKEYGGKERSKGLKEIFEIATYPVEAPTEKLVACLGEIEGIETQKSLILKLQRKGIIQAEDKDKASKKSYMEFRRDFLNSLCDKGWMTKEDCGRSSRLEITDAGKEILKIFG